MIAQASPALARQLDVLSRRAHAFHRFAHHPLCAAYRGEVFRLGRRFSLCRGCTLVAFGAAIGLFAGIFTPVLPRSVLGVAAVLAIPLAYAVARRRSRAASKKLATRAVPALVASFLLVLGVRSWDRTGFAVAVGSAALAALATVLYRRRGPDRRPCLACPESLGKDTCSGFRAIVRREAAFARLASHLLAKEGAARSATADPHPR